MQKCSESYTNNKLLKKRKKKVQNWSTTNFQIGRKFSEIATDSKSNGACSRASLCLLLLVVNVVHDLNGCVWNPCTCRAHKVNRGKKMHRLGVRGKRPRGRWKITRRDVIERT